MSTNPGTYGGRPTLTRNNRLSQVLIAILIIAAILLVGYFIYQAGKAGAFGSDNPNNQGNVVATEVPGGNGNAVVAGWPKTAKEAADKFGDGDASRWELNPDGGWHMKEASKSISVDPKGYLAEGYYDTAPGKDAYCFAFTVKTGAQGATIWPESGTNDNAKKLAKKMTVPTWTDGSKHPCEVIS